MHIGILLAGHAPDPIRAAHGDFDAMFARLLADQDIHVTSFDVEQMVFPETPRDADGWLISGSRHGAYEDHPFIPPLEQFIRDAHDQRTPLVGICFGHQIIAQALGGVVAKHPDGWTIGRRSYATDRGPVTLNAWHQDQVIVPPEGARTLGHHAECPHAILAYDTALTVQAHPEFDAATLETYVAFRMGSDAYPKDRLQAARDGAGPVDQGRLASAIARFFKTGEAYV
ncbi:glutamine amidotransferase [Jannaschia pagri]|uniref:Glutamine amidotransferase n=1 Tax=Jannaschia pagri TaxID=2829797 RepID=A0ABQ4NHG7_9RHOB|nr:MULTISPECIES: type 1 glutamine amidotransferase [unclassified Jannaschia]GIT90033.1 glutamine amidotransferase [Jannaschia sp. AI_61]GIT93861.1 glutamine amidotransferase [Jannaschia sp. AI_62]